MPKGDCAFCGGLCTRQRRASGAWALKLLIRSPGSAWLAAISCNQSDAISGATRLVAVQGISFSVVTPKPRSRPVEKEFDAVSSIQTGAEILRHKKRSVGAD
jgi:hypothetical protein